MRELLSQVLEHLQPVIETVESTPVDQSDSVRPELLLRLKEDVPGAGESLDSVLQLLLDEAMPPSLSAISGGFMGYVPGGGLFHSALADLISGTINRYVGAHPVAPALSEIEASVIRWFCQIIGLPAEARGFMTSGGSLANQSALTIARTIKCDESFGDAIIYLSDQAHGCLSKAAKLCGFPKRNIRIVETDDNFRMSMAALRDAVTDDRSKGLNPMFVAANAGTTNSGAIDPLEEVARFCHNENIWFHIDAAYGGFFAITQRGRSKLSGISEADSIALDPHKTLFLPYGTGALLVRNGDWLKQTYQSEADYLPDTLGDDDAMDFRDISPELTRPFRGLRVWLPLKVHGADAFAACLDEKMDLIARVYASIKSNPALDVLASPELSIMAFAMTAKPDETIESQNERSRQLLARINQKNRVHLSGTLLKGRYALRVAVGVYRTHESHIDILLADLQASINELEEIND
ncbi:MAG: aspartate aminotransferase family protein [Gammaproteobacteria bacterium]